MFLFAFSGAGVVLGNFNIVQADPAAAGTGQLEAVVKNFQSLSLESFVEADGRGLVQPILDNAMHHINLKCCKADMDKALLSVLSHALKMCSTLSSEDGQKAAVALVEGRLLLLEALARFDAEQVRSGCRRSQCCLH